MQVLALLLVSGGLLAGGFVLYRALTFEGGGGRTLLWPGSTFRMIEGAGAPSGDGLRIYRFAANGRASAMVTGLKLDAAAYRFLDYRIEGLDPRAAAALIWVTREFPRSLRVSRLSPDASGAGALALSEVPYWSGEVTRVGLLFEGSQRRPLVIRDMTVRSSYAPLSELGLVWRDWTAFEGWAGYSINFIVGGPKQALIHPVPAVAAWVGLALILYWVWMRARRRPTVRSVWVLIPLFGWLALDSRWLLDLARQNLLTEQLFAGKTAEEKRLADKDGSLYEYILSVKQALPESPQRVFLVTEQPFSGTAYVRLRAAYHLLPHNVFSHLSTPPSADQVRAGDYVLLLDRAAAAVRYDAHRGLLVWPGGRLAAAAVLVGPDGGLYRILSEQGATDVRE